MVKSPGQPNETTETSVTTYVGGLFDKTVKPDGTVEEKFYVYGGGSLVAVKTRTSGSTKLEYAHTDHLGSVALFTDTDGNVVANSQSSFDAFAQRRDDATWGAGIPARFDAPAPRRGYTGHEQLDEVGLVHMNGRIYDPVLGRFMTGDPVVQSLYNLQNLNRYSYVLNNPLSFTDPSGYKFSLKSFARIVVMAALTYATAGIGMAITGTAWGAGAIAGGFASMMTAGPISQGGLKSIAIGALTGALAGAIGPLGESATSSQIFQHALQNGLVGGVGSLLSGDSVGRGFLSGFAGAYGSGYAARVSGPVMQGVAATIAGGTASVIGGGKFANGAAAAAFTYIIQQQAGQTAQQTAPVQLSANEGVCTTLVCRPTWGVAEHCSTFVAQCGDPSTAQIERQYSLKGFQDRFESQSSRIDPFSRDTFSRDREAFRSPGGSSVHIPIAPPPGVSARQFADQVIYFGDNYVGPPYQILGPNSNSAAAYPIYKSGGNVPQRWRAPGLDFFAP